MMYALRILALVLFTPITISAATLEEEVDQTLKQTDSRQEKMLRSMLRNPYPQKGISNALSMWHYEDFAIAAYWLNERTAEADAGILTLRKEHYPVATESFDEGAFHWHAYLLQRIYFLFGSHSKYFPGRMSTEAEEAIVEMLWGWASPVCRKELTLPERIGWCWGSENHHMMAWVSFWGAAHIFKNHPDYKDRRYADGSTPAEMAEAFDEYFKAYAREQATKGLMAEVASPGYTKYTLNTWYNLADFADDPVLKHRMDMLLNLYWADWAIEQIDGVRGGSRHRCYPGINSLEHSGGEEAAWYHFERGTFASKHPGAIGAATTFWRPARIVVELALDTEGRGEYASISRRPGLKEPGDISNFVDDPTYPLYVKRGVYRLHPQGGALLRTSWCSPDFVAGMSQVSPLPWQDWTHISSQNRWNGVIFAGNKTARIFTQPLKPEKGSVYNAEWGVQSKGVMILQRLRTSNAQGQLIWFDHSLRRVENGGWVFVEAPQAYAAVRIAEGGGHWKPDSLEQHRDARIKKDLGEWLALNHEYSPIIIEVARKKDYADFAAFQKAILANPLSLQSDRIEYRSQFYDTTLTLPLNADGPPLIDGKSVDFKPKAVYDSPYLQGDFGGTTVTIRKGAKVLTLDF